MLPVVDGITQRSIKITQLSPFDVHGTSLETHQLTRVIGDCSVCLISEYQPLLYVLTMLGYSTVHDAILAA